MNQNFKSTPKELGHAPSKIMPANESSNRVVRFNVGVPKYSGIEQVLLSKPNNYFIFVDLTAYPQRSALEPLLTID